MALFDFKLKPLQDVMPWGDEPNKNLHWFGLTDGFYYMDLGDVQLFRYSDEILKLWSKDYQDSNYINEPYMDYQVVRLYEDILEILPDVIQPIPEIINSYISTKEKQRDWEKRINEDDVDFENEEEYDTYANATEWLFFRRLKGLGGSPGIIIWRVEDTIHIRWDNASIKQDGINTWATTEGEYELPFNNFMSEVESFHNRLIKNMGERVNAISKNNPLPHIKIDIDELQKEQVERAGELNETLSKKPNIESWDKVILANKELLE